MSSDEEEPIKVMKPLKKNPLTWTECAASGSLLLANDEIMGGNTGQLFYKQHVMEHLRDWRQDKLSAYHEKEDFFPNLCSINRLSDVKDLKLKANPAWEDYIKGKSTLSKKKENELGRWICPISGLATDGMNEFYFSWNCGCLVSEQAIEEGPQEEKCLVCETPYREIDLVQACPKTKKELDKNQAKFMVREMSKIMDAEEKKRAAEQLMFEDTDDDDIDQPSTSRASTRRNFTSRIKTARERSQDSTSGAGPSTSGTSSTSKRQKS